MFSVVVLVLVLFGTSQSEYTDPHCGGKQVIVHLFEWKWTDVALECERFLSKKGFCGVQVSPANEHVMVKSPPAPWWERYQPVSYKLDSRSGTEAEFTDMVNRCKAVGVRIYVDVVLNHMAGLQRSGIGSAGSSFNSDNYDFPGVPFVKEHFNDYCVINNYGDPNVVRNCHLVGLTDLNQGNEYVRNKIAEFLNRYIDLGVAGFRVDAAKHMWPQDIAEIQNKLKDMPEGGSPFFYHEVIDQNNEPIKTSQYTSLGYVTEFRYCTKLREGAQDFGRLNNAVDYGWGMTDSEHAFVFVDNHDNQRGHGGGGQILTFEKPKDYKLAVAFLLANDYGFARVMSSYYFGDNSDQGPPHYNDYSTKEVTINSDGSCGNGWVCEHRWDAIANMVAFRNAVVGTHKENVFNQNNQIAFSRGNKGFFAMARDGHMDQTLQTGLPAGEYCDLISECAKKITVDGSGMARIVIDDTENPIVAFIVGGPASGPNTGGSSGSTQTGSGVTSAPDTTTPSGPPQTGSGVTSAPDTTTPSGPSPTAPAGWSRTVILIERHTVNGQNVFIRGGLDHGTHKGCSSDFTTSNCVIPIKHRSVGNGSHYDWYNAWSVNDNYIDWYGAEPNQGRANGVIAQGTPAVWTTNNPSHPGFNKINTYGDHYWLVDVDMDCSKTDQGWFELKAVLDGHWEGDIYQGIACKGGVRGQPPSSNHNHWARCGMLNVYHYGASVCEIKPLP